MSVRGRRIWKRTAKGAGFALVTCDPNELVSPIHPKAMITILHPDNHARWLGGSYDELAAATQRAFDYADAWSSGWLRLRCDGGRG